MSESDQRGSGPIGMLRRLVIDFHAGVIELEGDDGSRYRLKAVPEPAAEEQEPSPTVAASSQPAAPAATESSGQRTVRLIGRLKSTPREGRPDGRGRPTAWAK